MPTHPVDGHDLLRVKEAAAALGVSVSTVYRLIREGVLGCVKIPGAKVKIQRRQLEELLERSTIDPPPPGTAPEAQYDHHPGGQT